MHHITFQDRSVALGPNGFLAEFAAWDEEVARCLAEEDGLNLTDCHWTAIRFIREFYQTYEVPPTPRVLIREIGNELHAVRCTYGTLKELFPQGGCKQACRLAGLPDYYCQSC